MLVKIYCFWQDPLANAPLELKVKSLERYLGVDLVAFRLREAKAELFAAESLVEEKGEWKANPAAGRSLKKVQGFQYQFHFNQFISQLTCYANGVNTAEDIS